MYTCGICHKGGITKTFTARELQFGTREEFQYFECDECGCLQITEIPANIGDYYPQDYYSYASGKPSLEYSKSPFHALRTRFLLNILSRHYFFRKSLLGRLIAGKSSLSGDYPSWIKMKTIDLGVRSGSSILDVGGGSGKLLLDLSLLGFTNLVGIDPFIERDIHYSDHVRILKRSLNDMHEQFDLVMFNHSFEHMPDPLGTLQKAHELVKPGHFLILRIPIAGSYAWREYGVNWAGLDAPRHFFLHTPKSISLLAAQVGFEVAEVVFDAEGFAHWGSELYRRGLSVIDHTGTYSTQNMFTPQQLTEFAALDDKLNRSGEADSAAFCLYKPKS